MMKNKKIFITGGAGFLGKNGKYILIGAVVIIGGYFAWKKFGK